MICKATSNMLKRKSFKIALTFLAVILVSFFFFPAQLLLAGYNMGAFWRNAGFSISGSASIVAGSCNFYTVSALGPATTTNRTLNLTSSGGGVFYSNAICTVPITSVVMTANTRTISYYYRDTVAEAVTQQATLTSAPAATFAVTVTPDAPYKLTLSGGDGVVIPNSCYWAPTIEVRDQFNNISPLLSGTTITYSGTNAHFDQWPCAGVSTSTYSLNAGDSSFSMTYYVSGTPQILTVTASAPGLVSGTANVRVVSTWAYEFLAPLQSNTCVPFKAKSVDAAGNLLNLSSNDTITWGPGYDIPTDIYTDSGCTNVSTGFTMNAGQNTTGIYYVSSTRIGAGYILFSNTSNDPLLDDGPYPWMTFVAGNAAHLQVVGPTYTPPNQCSDPFYVLPADTNNARSTASGNITVTLGTTGSAQFYSAANCTGSISSVVIPSGDTKSDPFYMKNAATQNVVITASNGSLTAGTFNAAFATGQAVSSLSSYAGNPYWNGLGCVVANGAARCWGNVQGVGRAAQTVDAVVPVQVDNMTTGVTQVSVGDEVFACALKSGGVWCWNNYDGGGLGDGVYAPSATPVAVLGLGSGVTQITAGAGYACAIQSGTVYCWGGWDPPAAVANLSSNVTYLVSRRGGHCAIDNGALKCWGNNNYGQYGDGTTNYSATPVLSPNMTSGVTAAFTSGESTCAVKNGDLYCWAYDVLGFNGGGDWTTPHLVSSGTNYTYMWNDGYHYTFIDNGALYVMGFNWGGELGLGYITGGVFPPAASPFATGVTEAVIPRNACMIRNGNLQCWGSLGYETPNGTYSEGELYPLPVGSMF